MVQIEEFRVKGDAPSVARNMVFAQGATYVGSGAYANVYGNERRGVAYKIFRAKSNNAYLNFLKELLKLNTPNRFLPRIYGVRLIKNQKDDWGNSDTFVVAMEMLQELDNKHEGVVRIIEELLESKSAKGNDDVVRKVLGLRPTRELDTALNLITRANKGRKYTLDIHSGNIMLRDNSQVVITDPLA